jgi:hypothetical protein
MRDNLSQNVCDIGTDESAADATHPTLTGCRIKRRDDVMSTHTPTVLRLHSVAKRTTLKV